VVLVGLVALIVRAGSIVWAILTPFDLRYSSASGVILSGTPDLLIMVGVETSSRLVILQLYFSFYFNFLKEEKLFFVFIFRKEIEIIFFLQTKISKMISSKKNIFFSPMEIILN